MKAGSTIGTFEIISLIGRGGMGEVYLARDTRLDRQVAIKALPEILANDLYRLGRFEREAKTLATLNHPNVAGIHGVEEQEGRKYLVLEYVEGETLAERLDRGSLPIDEALEVCTQIAAGVEAAHEAGIIHRDLKPGNINITPQGKVKVLDFGLAKVAEGSSSGSHQAETVTSPAYQRHSPTMPGVILGTAAYMSPEQARGRAVDKRTDIWSFGVVLYECLTGTNPFVGETVSDSIGAILHKDVDLNGLPPATPPTIRLLLRRCLAKDQKNRLHDIADARIEIEHAIADPNSSTLGLVTAVVDPDRQGHRRSVSISALVIAVVLTSAIAVVFSLRFVPEPAKHVRKYEIPLHDRNTWNVGQPAICPDGDMVAYVDQERIWIRHLDTWEARAVENSERGIIPFWSPDGKWLAFGRGQELLKVPATGGRPVLITQASGTFAMIAGGAWSADGRIFFSTGDSGIFVVPAVGGVAEFYLKADLPDDDDIHELTLLPDGKTVIFTVHSRTQPWYLGSFDGKERKVAFSFGGHFAVTPAYSPTGHLLLQRFGGGSSTWAIPFDCDRLEVTGTPFLVADGDSDPSVSNTGTLVLIRSISDYFGGDLVKVDLDSGVVQPFAVLGGVHHDHALAPDGKSLAFSGFELNARDLWIHDVESGSRTRLTFDESMNELLPRWSPDGKQIAYAKTTASAFDRIAPDDKIHFLAVDGSGETRPPIDGAFPTLDRDWRYIAFVRTNEATGRDIYFRSMDGNAEAQKLLGEPYAEEHPAISPDGRWLLYTSSESGAQAVYLTRFPSGQGKWQVSGQDGVFPRWSPDGTRVYFIGQEVGIFEVQLTAEPRVMLSSPRRVVDGPRLSVDPFLGMDFADNGQAMILVQSRGTDRPTTIGVIENWYEEFREGRRR